MCANIRSVRIRTLFAIKIATSLCILTICKFSYFPFGFESWIWVLIQ